MTLLELCYLLKGQITHFLHPIWPFCEFLRYDLTSCLHSKQSKIHLINFVTFWKTLKSYLADMDDTSHSIIRQKNQSVKKY